MIRQLCALFALLLLAACSSWTSSPDSAGLAVSPPPAPASPTPPEGEFQYCVPYARAVSGVEIFGDAWTWWEAAKGRYARGAQPVAGSVLVWKRDNRLRNGHVAVVTRVVGPREILVTHANWGWGPEKPRGQVDHDISVIDVSPGNDWSAIQVWNGGSYGRTYQTHGFIYPGRAGQSI